MVDFSSASIAYSTEAQIATYGTTATQVNGNAIAPTGSGTANGGNLYHSFSEFNVPQSGVIFNTGNSAVSTCAELFIYLVKAD